MSETHIPAPPLPWFWPPPQNQLSPGSLRFGGWGESVRLVCWEGSGCTVPFVRLSKLIMLIGALRFLKPALLDTFPSPLASRERRCTRPSAAVGMQEQMKAQGDRTAAGPSCDRGQGEDVP